MTYFAMAWGVAHHSLSGWQMLGAGRSCAWLSVLPHIPAAHELYHARGLTLYNFAPRAVWETSIHAQRLNSDALEKRGLGRWSIQHMLWLAILRNPCALNRRLAPSPYRRAKRFSRQPWITALPIRITVP